MLFKNILEGFVSNLYWNLDYRSHNLFATKSETRREGEERKGAFEDGYNSCSGDSIRRDNSVVE
jgi:hypothetical protein